MLSLEVHNEHVVRLTLPDGNTILIRRHDDKKIAIEAPRDIEIERLGYVDMETMVEMCKKLREKSEVQYECKTKKTN